LPVAEHCGVAAPVVTPHRSRGLTPFYTEPERDKNGRFIKGINYSPATQFKKGEHWREPQLFRDKAWLELEYLTNGRSCGDIAKQFGITEAAILFWLRRHKIPRRSIAEARKIKYWGCSGEKNPMYGMTGILSHNWKGGLTPFRQRVYASAEWQAFSRKIKRRDKACRLCGSKDRCHIHHIEPISKAALLIMDEYNVILLCIDCHHKVTRRERWWRKKLYRLIQQKAG
jgi:HNH endonuclease